ncbi:hypothetical protein [Tessaracoccus oleiagri]|uniref:Uncharacterized protein n=1 Tax=Tessaracoccus oleiagri TaxID=686624 RepID=A0A1G9JHE7_9ACTN|nr:hypothetical protein [Tessaracoccus oleiagri]SDL36712.1 hypothetical protein SAMN04488242_1242 [Tessaracoccus oleiagri]
MIVLLAHDGDPWADELARRVADLSGAEVGLCGPRDLSRPGWALHVGPGDGRPADSRVVVGGRAVDERDVDLVVSLLDDVLPAELLWIREEDTDYVACEMSAVLRYWLESLGDHVLVPPGTSSLAGPDHPVALWARAAGIEWSRPEDWRGCREVAVVNGEAWGDASPPLRRAATAMAGWAHVPWLRAFFAPAADVLWGVATLPSPLAGTDAPARAIAAAARRPAERGWAA